MKAGAVAAARVQVTPMAGAVGAAKVLVTAMVKAMVSEMEVGTWTAAFVKAAVVTVFFARTEVSTFVSSLIVLMAGAALAVAMRLVAWAAV